MLQSSGSENHLVKPLKIYNFGLNLPKKGPHQKWKTTNELMYLINFQKLFYFINMYFFLIKVPFAAKTAVRPSLKSRRLIFQGFYPDQKNERHDI